MAEAESEWDNACVRLDSVAEFVAGGQRDPKQELIFRKRVFPGSQSLKMSKDVLDLQVTLAQCVVLRCVAVCCSVCCGSFWGLRVSK